MPLLDLKTDLKSLKYGQDQPGGGSSGQPYIKTDINTVDSGLNRLRFTKFDDGLIRGGAVGTANAAIVDTLRIGKFLTDAPQGPLFIVKQVGLQLSNPQLEAKLVKTDRPISGQGFLNNAINFVSNVAGNPTRIYNLGINTLAQVPVNAIGGHIVRHGFLPNNDDSKYYGTVVKTNAGLEDNSVKTATDYNRLLGLANNFNLGPWGANKYGVTRREQGTINRLFGQLAGNANPIGAAILGGVTGILNTNKELEINNYIAGPGSVYGIGTTIIRRAMDSDTENKERIDLAIEQSEQFAGKTRDKDNNIQDVNYTSGLGKGGRAIYNYGSISTGSNEINQGINNYSDISISTDWKNPSLKTYTTLKQQLQKQQSPKNHSYTEAGAAGVNNEIYVNQFGIYNTQRDGLDRVNNANSNYSTDASILSTVSGSPVIAYQNTYGDVIKIKGFKNWREISRENRISSGRKDGINLTPIFSGLLPMTDKDGNPVLDAKGKQKTIDQGGRYFGNDSVTIDDKSYNIRDLVKFRIQAVNTESPSSGDWMVFRAYLTSFSDNAEAKWTDITYTGRGNPFYIYTGFSRKIQVGFKVAALSAEEMRPMYQKLNYLMASLMPDYKDNIMRGPLHRLTVGNYIDSQLGKLDSVSYTIPNDSPWEIAIDEPEGGTKQLILPHIIEVQMSFTPIGAETKQENLVEAKNDDTSFIAQNNTGADAQTIQYYRNFPKSK